MNDKQHECGPQRASPGWIAGRIGTLLDHYYQPEATPETTEAAMADWIRILLDMPKAAISASCDSYLRDQPRRRPTPGDIYNRANSWMYSHGGAQRPRVGPPDAPALPKPTRTDADRKAAEEVLQAAGFTPHRFKAVSAHRMATAPDELVTDEGPRVAHWSELVAEDDPSMAALKAARDENKLIQEARESAARRAAK